MSNMCTSSPHSIYIMVKNMVLTLDKVDLLQPGGSLAFWIAQATSPLLWVTDWPLAKLADNHIERCYITRKRMGSRREWILTNQGTGNSHCGTVLDTFSRERILTLNKRERLYLFLSKWHQETGIITADTYSKSGVFMIQLTCSTGLRLRTGAQNLSPDESIRPTT